LKLCCRNLGIKKAISVHIPMIAVE